MLFGWAIGVQHFVKSWRSAELPSVALVHALGASDVRAVGWLAGWPGSFPDPWPGLYRMRYRVASCKHNRRGYLLPLAIGVRSSNNCLDR